MRLNGTFKDIHLRRKATVTRRAPWLRQFNRIVNDYNSRYGSYRYRQGSQSRAERDVEAYRSQIALEPIREARQLGRSCPSVSPGISTSTAPKKPNAQYTREAQQILTDLGYDPGPVDGGSGRRTADAVKAFQKAQGIVVDRSVKAL